MKRGNCDAIRGTTHPESLVSARQRALVAERSFRLYGIGQSDRVQHRRRFVSHFQHERSQAAFAFRHAAVAMVMREAAGAGHQGERSARDPDDVAVADIHRR